MDRKHRKSSQRKEFMLYFNLNYYCNCNCVFCASNSAFDPSKRNKSIYATEFCSILEKFRRYKIISIVINGGEPTLNKDIIDILQITKEFNSYCILFTNGNRLSNYNFAKALMSAFKGSISIPLYGSTLRLHDSLTQRKNSFKETIAGIRNFFRIRALYRLPLKLELKLLFIKPLLEENVKIAKFLINNLPKTDILSINSLIESSTVKKNSYLIPDVEELKISLNKVLSTIRNETNFSAKKVCIQNSPICLLEKENDCFIPKAPKIREKDYKMLYFDPYEHSICNYNYNYTHSHKPICSICNFRFSSSNMITPECPYNK
jgi:molybdenum cofactor biosynthesis enzyme MoaA